MASTIAENHLATIDELLMVIVSSYEICLSARDTLVVNLAYSEAMRSS